MDKTKLNQSNVDPGDTPYKIEIKNIFVCIIDIQVPHEIRDQRGIAQITSQIMKWACKLSESEVVLVALDKHNLPYS